jgi:hypothetical protein
MKSLFCLQINDFFKCYLDLGYYVTYLIFIKKIMCVLHGIQILNNLVLNKVCHTYH